MNEYDKQANDFLEQTGTTIQWKYDGWYKRLGDEPTLNYRFTIKRGGREYGGLFSDSISNTFDNITSCRGVGASKTYHEYSRKGKTLHEIGIYERLAKRYEPKPEDYPSNYSLLACLQKYEVGSDVDDFALEFGYDLTTSKIGDIIATHRVCLDEYSALCALYSEDEMEQLQDIN